MLPRKRVNKRDIIKNHLNIIYLYKFKRLLLKTIFILREIRNQTIFLRKNIKHFVILFNKRRQKATKFSLVSVLLFFLYIFYCSFLRYLFLFKLRCYCCQNCNFHNDCKDFNFKAPPDNDKVKSKEKI